MFDIGMYMALVCFALTLYIVLLVKKQKLQLRYSMGWLFMGVVMLLCSIFPQPLFSIARFLGFQVGSNFLFFIGVVFLLCICLSLTSIVSKQQDAIKNLSQRIAIIEHDIFSKGAFHDESD